MMDLKPLIREVPDFPKKGIVFKDITPLLANARAMREVADALAEPFRDRTIDTVAGVEARGWIFGSMLAERLETAFVPIRKPGKLPYRKISRTYGLEYGTNTIEIHTDAIEAGHQVLMVDDLLATGGTMSAACELVKELGGEIAAIAFVIELAFLPGREKLSDYDLHTLLRFDGV